MKTTFIRIFIALTFPYLLADLYILSNRIFKFHSLGSNFLDALFGYIFAYCLFFAPLYSAGLIYLLLKKELRKPGFYCLLSFMIYFLSLIIPFSGQPG